MQWHRYEDEGGEVIVSLTAPQKHCAVSGLVAEIGWDVGSVAVAVAVADAAML